MQVARAVLLHDELERARRLLLPRASGGLRRDVEAPLAVVFGESAVAAEIVERGVALGHAQPAASASASRLATSAAPRRGGPDPPGGGGGPRAPARRRPRPHAGA